VLSGIEVDRAAIESLGNGTPIRGHAHRGEIAVRAILRFEHNRWHRLADGGEASRAVLSDRARAGVSDADSELAPGLAELAGLL